MVFWTSHLIKCLYFVYNWHINKSCLYKSALCCERSHPQDLSIDSSTILDCYLIHPYPLHLHSGSVYVQAYT